VDGFFVGELKVCCRQLDISDIISKVCGDRPEGSFCGR